MHTGCNSTSWESLIPCIAGVGLLHYACFIGLPRVLSALIDRVLPLSSVQSVALLPLQPVCGLLCTPLHAAVISDSCDCAAILCKRMTGDVKSELVGLFHLAMNCARDACAAQFIADLRRITKIACPNSLSEGRENISPFDTSLSEKMKSEQMLTLIYGDASDLRSWERHALKCCTCSMRKTLVALIDITVSDILEFISLATDCRPIAAFSAILQKSLNTIFECACANGLSEGAARIISGIKQINHACCDMHLSPPAIFQNKMRVNI